MRGIPPGQRTRPYIHQRRARPAHRLHRLYRGWRVIQDQPSELRRTSLFHPLPEDPTFFQGNCLRIKSQRHRDQKTFHRAIFREDLLQGREEGVMGCCDFIWKDIGGRRDQACCSIRPKDQSTCAPFQPGVGLSFQALKRFFRGGSICLHPPVDGDASSGGLFHQRRYSRTPFRIIREEDMEGIATHAGQPVEEGEPHILPLPGKLSGAA